MDANPEYISSLEQLPEKEREALLHGNWNIHTGVAFPEFSYAVHTCEDFPIPEHWRKWMAVDNGYTDPFYWAWFAVSPDGIVYLYREFTREREDDKLIYSEQAKKVKERMKYSTVNDRYEETYVEEKISYIVAGLDAWNKHHRDQSGKMLVDYYAEGGLYGFVKAVTDRKVRKATMHEYLKPIYDEVTGEAYSKLQVFRKACPSFIENLPELIEDEKDYETVMDCSFDHAYDAVTYGIISHHVRQSHDPVDEKNGIWKVKEKLAKKLSRKKKFLQ